MSHILSGSWTSIAKEDQPARYQEARAIGYNAASEKSFDGPLYFLEDPEGVYEEIIGPIQDRNELEPKDCDYWRSLYQDSKLMLDLRIHAMIAGWRARICEEQRDRWLSEPLQPGGNKLVLCEASNSKRYFLVAPAKELIEGDEVKHVSRVFYEERLAEALDGLYTEAGLLIKITGTGAWEAIND